MAIVGIEFMGNQKTEQSGLDAVLAFESKEGRSWSKRVSKCGYDIITAKPDGSDERHIEVKATSKDRFTFRWLEELEQQALKADDRFYLYLVTKAGSCSPRVFVYDRNRLNELSPKAITHYVYVFPKSDFLPENV